MLQHLTYMNLLNNYLTVTSGALHTLTYISYNRIDRKQCASVQLWSQCHQPTDPANIKQTRQHWEYRWVLSMLPGNSLLKLLHHVFLGDWKIYICRITYDYACTNKWMVLCCELTTAHSEWLSWISLLPSWPPQTSTAHRQLAFSSLLSVSRVNGLNSQLRDPPAVWNLKGRSNGKELCSQVARIIKWSFRLTEKNCRPMMVLKRVWRLRLERKKSANCMCTYMCIICLCILKFHDFLTRTV